MRLLIRHPRISLARLKKPVLAVVVALFGLTAAVVFRADAQIATGPKIQSLIVSSWTSASANISYKLNVPSGDTSAEIQIEYGTSASYGQFEPSSFAEVRLVSGGGNVLLTGLSSATTYHFRMRVKAVGSTTISDTSADKTFTTRASDSSGAPTVTVEYVECADTSCTLTFSTATEANVRLGWDRNFKNPTAAELCNPPIGYDNCVRESEGLYLKTSRQLRITGLTASTEYHYRFVAYDRGDGYAMTGSAAVDSTLTTAASGRDRTFTTGGCKFGEDRYPIGSCLPDGSYCSPSGPDTSCTNSCGASCPTGRTCRASGLCDPDPALTDSPYQCNKAECFQNGVLKNPAAAGCWTSWPKCSANTILKVTKDRACNLWMTCGTSLTVPAAKNQPAETLCLSLAACNQLGPEGRCTHYLPQGQCDNDPLRFCANDKDCLAGGQCALPKPKNPTSSLRDLTFNSPGQVASLANLSGNVVPGVDWTIIGGRKIVPGMLPWQFMRQIGGNIPLQNADFETNPPNTTPWQTVPLTLSAEATKGSLAVVLEDRDNSPNHVLRVSPVKQIEKYACVDSSYPDNPKIGRSCSPDDGADYCGFTRRVDRRDVKTGECQRVFENVDYFGAATPEFTTNSSEYYYAAARIRAETGNPIIRFEFGTNDFRTFTVDEPTESGDPVTKNAYVDIQASSAWQTVTIGPIRGLSGLTRLAAVCADYDSCGEYFLDDVMVKPVLQTTTNPDYVTPSCRLYPREDSPSCDYVDQNGVAFKGWKGYCLETDSVSGSCLSWWPVDIIKGESNIFGSDTVVGYQDRAPMYYCAEAIGSNYQPSTPYTLSENNNTVFVRHGGEVISILEATCNAAGNRCDDQSAYFASDVPAAIAVCAKDRDNVWCGVGPQRSDKNILEDQIAAVRLTPVARGDRNRFPTFFIGNTPSFRSSSASRPYQTINTSDNEGRITQTVYFSGADDPNYNHWKIDCAANPDHDLNADCVWLRLVFEKTSGKLHEYQIMYRRERGNDEGREIFAYGGAAFKVDFILKEQCSKIVQVVTPFGDNQAFAQRINSRTHLVSELGYKRSTDVLPYSGIAGPNPLSQPESWTQQIAIETKTKEFEEGQVRSGPAYACKGNCSTAICHVAEPTLATDVFGQAGKILAPTNACVTTDSDTNGLDDGFMSGGVQAASSRGPQLFNGTACLNESDNLTCNTEACYCKGTNQCVTPFTDVCSASRDVTGSGSTRSAAKNSATRACQDGPGVFSVACDGRCGADRAETFFKRFTEFEETGLNCTVEKKGSCDPAGKASVCSVTGTPCTTRADCRGGLFDFCTTKNVYACSNNRAQSCSRNTFGRPSDECKYQDPVPEGSIDTICRNIFLTPSLCTCTMTGQCVVKDNPDTVGTDEREYQNAGVDKKTCTQPSDCSFSPESGADVNRFYAQEKLKRLFTQSYGIWEWSSITGRYEKQDNSSSDAPRDKFNGWTPPSTLCPINEIHPTTSCQKFEQQQCTATKPVTSDARSGATDEDAINAALANALSICKNTPACDGRNAECSAKGIVGTRIYYNNFNKDSCVKTADGKWKCSGTCTTNATYVNAVPVLSKEPVFIATRPTTQPEDYCAIPPSFKGAAFTTGSAATAIIDGGGGSVGIKFNTTADAEQVPLRTISIDWGDGSPDTISYPYAPKSDPRKPHIISHVYTYNKADSVHCPVLNGPCTYPIRIQVKDNWGWCNESAQKWCSRAILADRRSRDQTPVACTSDSDCRGSGAFSTCAFSANPTVGISGNRQCQDSSAFWVETGLKVILQP